MANFPNIQKPSNITETDITTRLMETSSAGYVMLRGRGTVIKKEFDLEWISITSVDKATLQGFFNTNFGQSFLWTHFETLVSYTVCFKEDKLKFSYIAPGYWKLNLTLREL
jgi:hypothetical protein